MKHEDYVLIEESKLITLLYIIAFLIVGLVAAGGYIYKLHTTPPKPYDPYHGGGGGSFAVVRTITAEGYRCG